MRWYHTLFFRITLIFSIAFIAILGIGIAFTKHQNARAYKESSRIVHALLRSAYDRQNERFNEDFLHQEGLMRVDNIEQFERYLKRIPPHMRMGNHAPNMRGPITTFAHNSQMYAFVSPKDGAPILFKTPFTSPINLHIIVFGLVIVLLGLLYLLTIRSIRPLGPLKESIEALANGRYEAPPPSKSLDEIGALTRAYATTVEKIKQLKNARQLFLRNIMHELKTPLTKAKLAVALIEESPYTIKLSSLLSTQENMLEEFARIEKLGSGEQTINPQTYHIDDILAQVRDLLPDENPNLTQEIVSKSLHVDFDLFCAAVKNLVDNALRYSSDKSAKIAFDGKVITISNHGDKLPHNLEDYAKPYFLGGNKQQESRGLGFGLFIALQVIELHGFTCKYEYNQGESQFIIQLPNRTLI
jgi:two-component system OmpR family sensor kinase